MRIWTSVKNLYLRRAWTGTFRRTPCLHVAGVQPVSPTTNVCEECVAVGDTWPALRLCMTCGHLGCCEKAKNQHALRHFEATGHPIVQAYRERGMHWMWCYVDKALLDPMP
jgi:uncharacterized UBP type Zn finger protein